MADNIYQLDPKGTVWLVYHRLWKGGGCTTHWAFVFDYDSGLTAFEAWQKARIMGNPPFHEVICLQLDTYPSPSRVKYASPTITFIRKR